MPMAHLQIKRNGCVGQGLVGRVASGRARPGRAGYGRGANGTLHSLTGDMMSYMFKPNPESRAAVERLMALAANRDRGEVMQWQELERASGIGRYQLMRENGTANGAYIMKRFHDRMLEERGIEIWPEREIGVRLLSGHEQATLPFKHRCKRARRQFRKSLKTMNFLNRDPKVSLSIIDARLVAMQLEMATQNIEILNHQLRDVNKNPPGSESIDRPPPATM